MGEMIVRVGDVGNGKGLGVEMGDWKGLGWGRRCRG